eukprot:2341716-Rhodomonas_salina.2
MTDNLVLNVYRQAMSGQLKSFNVDCTHHLTEEGHFCMVIRTTDFNHHFHKIAYTLVSNEDSEMHWEIFEDVKAAVHNVIFEYSQCAVGSVFANE